MNPVREQLASQFEGLRGLDSIAWFGLEDENTHGVHLHLGRLGVEHARIQVVFFFKQKTAYEI